MIGWSDNLAMLMKWQLVDLQRRIYAFVYGY